MIGRAVEELLQHEPREDRRGPCDQLVVQLSRRARRQSGTTRASSGSVGFIEVGEIPPVFAQHLLVAVVGIFAAGGVEERQGGRDRLLDQGLACRRRFRSAG